MANTFTARQSVAINGWECGTEIDLTMVVDFKVHPGCKQTMTDPAEPPTVEVDKIRFFDGKDEIQLPWSVGDRFTSATGFKDWLMQEAEGQLADAADDAADHRRDIMREDRV